jgi:hypothetical protein
MADLVYLKPSEWVGQSVAWPHGCALYLIEEQHPGPIKVGIAGHPVRRWSALQCGNPRTLHLRHIWVSSRKDCQLVEGAIKFRFAGSILRGEWIAEALATVRSEIAGFEI